MTTDRGRPRGGRARRRARRRLRLRRDARAARARRTSSTPSPAPQRLARAAARRSRAAARSSASAGRRSSARPRRARRRCCCTTTCRERGVRGDCEITLVMPFGTPVPPSPDTSAALLDAFAERGIEFVAGRKVTLARRRRASPCSTTAPSCPSTSSSACRSTARPTSCSRAGWPSTATCRSTRARSRRASRASTRSATSPPSACRRRASSPSARRASSRTLIVARSRGGRAARRYDGRGSCYIEFGGGPRRPGRRRLLLGPEADRDLPGAVGGARRREAALRREPPRALVRPLARPEPLVADRLGGMSSTRRRSSAARPLLSDALRAARGVPAGSAPHPTGRGWSRRRRA